MHVILKDVDFYIETKKIRATADIDFTRIYSIGKKEIEDKDKTKHTVFVISFSPSLYIADGVELYEACMDQEMFNVFKEKYLKAAMEMITV